MRNNGFYILGMVALSGLLLIAPVSAQTEADFQTKVNDNGGVTITKYQGWDTNITIPTVIGEKAVTEIGYGAFQNADLMSVVIPDGVTIGWNAFSGNKLTKLTIGKGVNVGRDAFSGNALTSVTLGADCHILQEEGFGYFAFFSYMCNGRKAGAYKIDAEWDRNRYSRQGSENWKKVNKTAEGYTYVETPYGLAIVDYNGESNRLSIPDKLNGKPVKYIQGLGNSSLTGVRIPDSVVTIGNRAFDNDKLSSGAIIGNGVTYIGAEAFSGCSLTSVTIPDSVVYIGESAFSGNKLTSVIIPDSVVFIKSRAFLIDELTSITIPANVSLGTWITSYDSGYWEPSFGNNFDSAYNDNGKQAGTYTRPDKYSEEWNFQAR